jgi:hypothetical protein
LAHRETYRANEIVVSGSEEEPVLSINDVNVELERVGEERAMWTSPMVFNYYASPLELAQGLIDVELALKEPTKDFINPEEE